MATISVLMACMRAERSNADLLAVVADLARLFSAAVVGVASVGGGARVLVADEPTSALDTVVQREVLALLRHLVRSEQLALMLISHDLTALDSICDRLAIMYHGQVVESGTTSEVLAAPRHPYTRSLLDSVPRLARGEVSAHGAIPGGAAPWAE